MQRSSLLRGGTEYSAANDVGSDGARARILIELVILIETMADKTVGSTGLAQLFAEGGTADFEDLTTYLSSIFGLLVIPSIQIPGIPSGL